MNDLKPAKVSLRANESDPMAVCRAFQDAIE
jgi:hypothetical protein